MTITLELSPQAEVKLRESAARAGVSVETYVRNLVEFSATGFGPRATMTSEEYQQLLRSVSEGMPPLPTLPDDFSRADIYDDHD